LGFLTEKETAEAVARGEKALTGWWKWAQPKLSRPVVPEFKIAGVILEKDIVLSGMIDKLEMISDKKVAVTDYKTGKQKSRNEIEGKTKNGSGDILRQLQFYKLILHLHSGLQMQTATVEFLEPNAGGKFSREEFEISDGEVEELKKIILRVAKEIVNLEFWNKTCDDKTCRYCAYRKLLG
jgi:CRISPR/Cas system-associated exonuclease Cas4 (RecB family)